MDTRKLTAHIDSDHEGRIEQDGWGITCRVDHAEDPELIRELVRRYNAFPALVEALDSLMYELKAIDEDYDMNAVYGQCDRLLKSIDTELGDKQE
jgi:hypothetical protein